MRALCLAGLVDSDRVAVCREFAATLAAPRSMGLLPSVTALCEQELCYHSCGGVDGVDGDGFDVCKHVGCADSPCLDFLKRACPEGLHDELDRLYDAVCAVGSPSPPAWEAVMPPPNTAARIAPRSDVRLVGADLGRATGFERLRGLELYVVGR